MTEVFVPLSLRCTLGHTEATVMVSSDADLRDNVPSFTNRPCPGCTRWTEEGIQKIEKACEQQSGVRSGIIPGRWNVLNQHWVNKSRDSGGDSILTLFNCSPITTEAL